MKKLLSLLFLLACQPALAQAPPGTPAPVSYLSTASTNSTLVQAGLTTVKAIVPINTTATIAFLKLYDKATAPTCGTDTPKWRIPVPVTTSPQVIIVLTPQGISFTNGFGFCLTGAIADNDSSNSVTGVAINFAVSRR